MKIFIAWSGSSSKKVATVLRDWLPTVVPAAQPWISSEDIEKGTHWSSELAKQLEQTSYGILCVTPGNQNSPWLNFEAGALSKSLDGARVSPFLLGVELSELPSTLSQFQATLYEKEDLLRLARAVNKACTPNDIEELRLQSGFDVCWPGLVSSFHEILRELQAETDEAIASLAASDMSLEESQSELRRDEIQVLEAISKLHDVSATSLGRAMEINYVLALEYINSLSGSGYLQRTLVQGWFTLTAKGRAVLVDKDLV